MRRAASDSRGLKGTLFLADLCMLILAWLPLLVTVGGSERLPAESMFVGLIAIGSAGLIMRYEGLYLSRLCAVRSIEVRLIARSTLYTALALIVLDRLLFSNVKTLILTTEVLIGALGMLVLLVTERAVFRSVLRASRQGGANGRDVLVIGAGAHAARIVSLMADHPDYGARVVGVLGDRPSADRNGLGELWLGPISDAERVALELAVTGVVLSAAASEDPDITTIVKRLQRRGVHVQVSNGLAGFDVQRLRQLHLAREPMIYLEASQPRWRDHLVKRCIDVVVSSVVLVLLAPLLAVVAIAIKVTDRGPVLFKQPRVGRRGVLFPVYKFRTMVPDAEALIEQVQAGNERSGPLFKIDVDPRVTRVGRLLRLTSLDEVPQLLNVLRGQMSIVGPRPALPSEVVEFDDELRRRELVQPGITGLWQVEARDSPSFDAYRRLDLFYVDNWTVVGDLEIMLDTLEHLFGRIVRAALSRTSRASQPAADVTARVIVATPVAVGAGAGGTTGHHDHGHDHGREHDREHDEHGQDDGVRASVHALRRHDGATTVA
jgi:exopolysaccharide biosynthesis polyprenyl glycosylphosphotransferase